MFGFNTYRYDDADTYTVASGRTTDKITSLDIDWIDGQVKVIPTDGNEVIISEDYQGDKEARRMRWKVENEELIIKYCASGNFLGTNSLKNKNLTLEIPRTMLAAMAEVKINLVSADLNVTDMTARELEIEVVSGVVALQGISVGALDVETVSGNITVEGTVKNIDLEGVSARMALHLTAQTATVDVGTVSGDVAIYLPADVSGFEAVVDAVSGSVNVSGFENVTNAKGYCRYGDGGIRINMDAVSGGLKIEKAVSN